MKNIIVTLLLSTFTVLSYSQHEQPTEFDHLLNKTWKAEGKWGDGSTFRQEVYYESALGGTLFIAKSKGFNDQQQTRFGWRNYGVRQFDPATGDVNFWEFDVFGGITSGKVYFHEKDIYYHYQYGEYELTDLWEYVDETTYNFKVGVYKDDKWEQIYLEAQFKTEDTADFLPSYKQHLQGSWTSKAWDGVLNETWSIDENGDLIQFAEYIENGEILYEASNKIEKLAGELLLITVIKDNNPKVFKASASSKNEIIFENSAYKNPSVVKYEFISDTRFKRTISGEENGKPTSYTFEFNRVK